MFRLFEANSWTVQRKRGMFKKAVQQARERSWGPFSTFPEKDWKIWQNPAYPQ